MTSELIPDYDDEDFREKYYADIYYVDNQTIESPEGYMSKICTTTVKQAKNSKRYWANSIPNISMQQNDMQNGNIQLTAGIQSNVEGKGTEYNKNINKPNALINILNSVNQNINFFPNNNPNHNLFNNYHNLKGSKNNRRRKKKKARKLQKRLDALMLKNTNNNKETANDSVNHEKKAINFSNTIDLSTETQKPNNNADSIDKNINILRNDIGSNIENETPVDNKIISINVENNDLLNVETDQCEATSNKDNDVILVSINKDDKLNNLSEKNNSLNQTTSENILKRNLEFNKNSPIHVIKNDLQNTKKQNNEIIKLESSDDESVIEIEIDKEKIECILIESSDEDTNISKINDKSNDKNLIPKNNSTSNINKNNSKITTKNSQNNKAVSPVLSIISSTSDDFIQLDVSKLNFSNESFDFDLGVNLKKNIVSDKNDPPNTIISSDLSKSEITSKSSNCGKNNEVFATPMNKGKRKQNEEKNYTLSENIITPFIDIYDSESSDFPESIIEVPESPIPSKKIKLSPEINKNSKDPSSSNNSLTLNITTANFNESNDCSLEKKNTNEVKIMPDCVKKVLYPDLKFEKISFDECIAQMDKFYNSSWGGENFDHSKIKSEMSGEKKLWKIDLTDKHSDQRRKKNSHLCFDCGSIVGHRTTFCPLKPKKCYMCGEEGHLQITCPNKFCLNCGGRTLNYSTHCNQCYSWYQIKCSICQMHGHPPKYCPDKWRRYHLTITNEIPLIHGEQKKPISELHCSICTQKGHLEHECKKFTPSNITPYISDYTPVYVPDGVRKPQEKSTVTVEKSVNTSFVLEKKSPNSKNNHNNIEHQQESNCDDNEELYIHINDQYSKFIDSKDASDYLDELSKKYNITYTLKKNNIESSIYCRGDLKLLNQFKDNVNNWCFIKLNFRLSRDREHLKKVLNENLKLLKKNHGNPVEIYNCWKVLRDMLPKADETRVGLIKEIKRLIVRCTIILNVIFLGQFGFNSGKQYVEQLENSLQNLNKTWIVSPTFFHHIMLNFCKMFSPLSDECYEDMVNKYKSNPLPPPPLDFNSRVNSTLDKIRRAINTIKCYYRKPVRVNLMKREIRRVDRRIRSERRAMFKSANISKNNLKK